MAAHKNQETKLSHFALMINAPLLRQVQKEQWKTVYIYITLTKRGFGPIQVAE
jgi:hypothetical protein